MGKKKKTIHQMLFLGINAQVSSQKTVPAQATLANPTAISHPRQPRGIWKVFYVPDEALVESLIIPTSGESNLRQ